MQSLKDKIDTAAGRIKADLVLKNANVISVFTNRIVKGDVAVTGGIISGIGVYSGKTEIDCTDKFISPGFIDAHLHIESTMVTPFELSKAVVKTGTTTLIADPHELVNVAGSAGVEYLLQASENIPLNIYVMLPSSVPATPFETNGADFTHEDMKKFINHKRVLGLGEVMCFTDVLSGAEHILNKIDVNKSKIIDGHAPYLCGNELQAYAAAGIMTDHECTTFAEAEEKAAMGLKILVREGSAAKNLQAIVSGLLKSDLPQENFMFCTDDKHLDDIENDGHILCNVKKAMSLGMSPIQAVRMASYNAARAYGLKDLGAIAPGYRADIIIFDSLDTLSVNSVYKDGTLITEKSFEAFKKPCETPEVLNTVKYKPFKIEQLALKAEKYNHIIEIVPNQILTKHLYEEIPSQNGCFKPNSSFNKLCVVERHRQSGNIAVCPFKGFNISGGAIATTVAHDSHNIIAAGDNDTDIYTAINYLSEIQGGYVIAKDGKIAAYLPLPIAGLMSDAPYKEVQQKTTEMLSIAHSMGIPKSTDPFITLSFMALPVIPSIRLTDRGLFDVDKFKPIENIQPIN